jgi:hypothetical protein
MGFMKNMKVGMADKDAKRALEEHMTFHAGDRGARLTGHAVRPDAGWGQQDRSKTMKSTKAVIAAMAEF